MHENNPGLTTLEAIKKLEIFGKNIIPERVPKSDIDILLRQLKNPLVYVLLIASLVTLFLKHISDFTIILLAVFINTVLGFIQERKANKSIEALKKLIPVSVKLMRDGKLISIDIEQVVPGDIVILYQGSKIPADGYLLEGYHFSVDESLLTGESFPVIKSHKDEVLMGTIVSSGKGIMVVEKTGNKTRLGQIAQDVQEDEEDTPIKKELKLFSKNLSILVLVLTITVFVIGIILNKNPNEIFLVSIALAVSAIPEGLLVGLTVVLAIGMQRILKRRGLVRNLLSAETLGGVTTICIDKTGTITEGKMKLVDFLGDEELIAEQLMAANDLDDPMLISAWEWAQKRVDKNILKEKKRIDIIPFSPNERYSASLNNNRDKNKLLYLNGSIELLGKTTLDKEEKKKIDNYIQSVTKKGIRVIVLVRKEINNPSTVINEKDLTGGFSFIGLVGFSDPVRKDVKKLFEKVERAGIRIIVITGDYKETALAVLKEVNINIDKDFVLTGKDIEMMKGDRLSTLLAKKERMLFARTLPEQKLLIINQLKSQNEVVAMMGDGVNDALAINKADIGIVVGEAADVAKETADIVLLDSSFETIVMAIEEGRGIYENLRKIILYLMSDAFAAIITVLGGIFLNIPLPVSAAQILWINLVSDGLPDLALAVDSKRHGIMYEPPRLNYQPLVDKWMVILIGLISIFSGLVALLVFNYIFLTKADLYLARTVTFAVLGINSLFYVFSIRTLKMPIWRQNIFDNKWLLLAIFGGLVIFISPFIIPSLGNFLGVMPLPKIYWLIVCLLSFLTVIMVELGKLVFNAGFLRTK